MQNDPPNTPVSQNALRSRHEFADPPVRGLLWAGATVVLMTAACIGIVSLMTAHFAKARPMDKSPQMRGVIVAPGLAPLERFPSPHLQMNPADDLASFRAREDAKLNSYGWVNRTDNVVRIPIERAMKLIVQRGLPTRASNAAPRTGKSELELIRERTPSQ